MLTNSDIWAFLGSNNISVCIHRRDADFPLDKQFYCEFMVHGYSANLPDGIFYKGIHGDGATPNEAFTNMCKLCSGKTVEFRNWTNGEYTPIKIQFPIFI